MNFSNQITGLLVDWGNGNRAALEELLPLVERELHRIAHNYMKRIQPGNTLQTTALINETYLLLIDQKNVNWQNRAHFFGIAAKLMRRFLLNYVRDQKTVKRGGHEVVQISLSDGLVISDEKSDELLALEDSLCGLAKFDERKARIVELRYFGGLSIDETAEVLKISKITVMRDWNMAKAWLAREIKNGH